jgi:glycosyltransferase involved in cell wall biosynthesis
LNISLKKFFRIIPSIFPEYNLIIGIDREGIIAASFLAGITNRPFALISYELLFQEETREKFKEIEIYSCNNIKFAVTQDTIRSFWLANENQIDPVKIINIPTAGREIKKRNRTKALHTELGIPHEKKIALFAGSIAKWTMIDEIVKSTTLWPDEWVLVLHSRYGNAEDIASVMIDRKSENVFFTRGAVKTVGDLEKIISSADVGIALYKSMDSGSIYHRNNLKYIGLASGKIATYLQYGLPIIVNEIGQMSEYVREFSLGFVVKDVQEISNCLPYITNQEFETRCHLFYDTYLNLNHHIKPLLVEINKLETEIVKN